ncbi:MAG: hypothetical protein ACRC28_08555, partial [Clostridium sp.]
MKKMTKKEVMKENGVYIRSYEGKDLIQIDGKDIKLKKYDFNLNYSLEIEKLENKILHNIKENRCSTNALINVSFKYGIAKTDDKEGMSTKQIREALYKEGFKLDGHRYVRYKRSASSAREGKCLFIRSDLYNMMMDWSRCGLDLDALGEQLPKLEAYISLTTSSIIDTMNIEPKNILLIDDFESCFEDTVMATTLDSSLNLSTKASKVKICNSIFDGESLIDIDLLPKRYKDKGGVQLRNRFFKGMAFNTNIQKFFNDNNITSIEQLNGKTIATKIEDIKFITTPSSIKYLAFGEFEKWLKNISNKWGICSTDNEKQKINNIDGLVNTHYQLLNTLNLKPNDISKLLEAEIDYVNKVINDEKVLLNHLEGDNDYDSVSNDILLEMLKHNPKIMNTSLFRGHLNDIKKSYA